MTSSLAIGGGIAKVLVVGNVATGKTSVINRFARNKFSKDYQTTIGVDFALKRVRVGEAELNVQLWDIAGQERFAGLSRIFYTHAVAAIIVYDVTARDTFDAVIKWKQDIDSKVFLPSGARIPVLLLGNKSDLLDEGVAPAVTQEEVDAFVAANNFYAHYLCSAKSGLNVKEACTQLVAKIHTNNQTDMRQDDANGGGAGGAGGAGSSSSSSSNASPSAAQANGHTNGSAASSSSASPASQTIKLGNAATPEPAKESGGCC